MKKVTNIEIASYFGILPTTISKQLRETNRFDYVYLVLTEDSLTISEKKEYLFSTSLSQEWKDKLWELHLEFIGVLDANNRFKN